MKTKRSLALIVSAMIAAASVTVPVYAEDTPMMTMDNPFADTVAKGEDGSWDITERGLKLLKSGLTEERGFYFDMSLSERVEETLTLNVHCGNGEKSVDTPYIMMIPQYSNEEGAHLYLPFNDIADIIEEEGTIKANDITEMSVKLVGVDMTDLMITAKSGVYASFTQGVYAAYTVDRDGNADTLADYFVFDDEANGRTSAPGTGIGVGFTCEQENGNIIFHMASADNVTEATAEHREYGSWLMTIDYGGDTGKKTYLMLRLEDVYPTDFDAAEFKPLSRGVWAAYNKTGDEISDISDYFIFTDTENGRTADPLKGTGVGFTCEQNGMELTFHFGSADDTTKAVLKPTAEGGYYVTIGYEGGPVTYYFTRDNGLDPDIFEVEPVVIIDRGVYAAYKDDGSGNYGKPSVFFIFYDKENGRTLDALTGLGVPFTCDQNENGILFHFASADDNTFTSGFEYTGDGSFKGTIGYEAGDMTYMFVPVADSDPDTFADLYDVSADTAAAEESPAAETAEDPGNPKTGTADMAALAGAAAFSLAAALAVKKRD